MSRAEAAPTRVSVDTEEAWLRIRGNLDQNMLGILEARLATLPGGKDGVAAQALRQEVEARLLKIRDDAFGLAKPNLRVNGFDYETYIPTTEAFDEALDTKVWGVEAERVVAQKEVAELRRQVPFLIQSREEDLERRRTRAEWLPDGEDGEEEATNANAFAPPPPRHDEVKKTFGEVVDNMANLVSTAPALLQRAQRAEHVREELSHLPK